MTANTALPVVSIVGRPNVGKSTLFNRILGRREAIVEERPGVTRDRKALEAEWLGTHFELVDTGGWMPSGNELDDKVSAQSEKAIEDSDLIVLVVDGTTGITEEDGRVVTPEACRCGGSPRGQQNRQPLRDADIWGILILGMGDPLGVSALHFSRNTGDLLDQIIGDLPAAEPESPDDVEEEEVSNVDEIPGVAIVGRPNVGKSTLFNRLIGDDRSVVHDMRGTTRDAIDTVVETELGPLRFIDTAGIRRKLALTTTLSTTPI